MQLLLIGDLCDFRDDNVINSGVFDRGSFCCFGISWDVISKLLFILVSRSKSSSFSSSLSLIFSSGVLSIGINKNSVVPGSGAKSAGYSKVLICFTIYFL